MAAPGPRIKAQPPNPALKTQVVQADQAARANFRACKLKARGASSAQWHVCGVRGVCKVGPEVPWESTHGGSPRSLRFLAALSLRPCPAGVRLAPAGVWPRRWVPSPCGRFAWRLIFPNYCTERGLRKWAADAA